ncbi:hypothetical protein T492DRAFT_851088 [Pavlovales sp. CCMP2436]|nr:hypothetical protein T492DRAFT_851088 [Pavlovales sp. CCMP2436]
MLDGAGDEAGLNPELKLDGTHMHPRCAGLLEAALLRSGWEPMASTSERLYGAAIAHAPAATAASYALNLAHVFELSLRYEEALSTVVGFLRQQGRERSVGAGGPSSEHVLQLLQDSTALALPAFGTLAKPQADGTPPPPPPPPPVALVAGAGEDLPKAGPLSAEGAVGSTAGGADYSAAELDMLALLLTMVKVLFVQGRLAPLPALINALEPARAGRKLHLTLVRNEHGFGIFVFF